MIIKLVQSLKKKKKISPNTCPWSKSLLAEAGKLKLTEDDPELRRSIRRKDLERITKIHSVLTKTALYCM